MQNLVEFLYGLGISEQSNSPWAVSSILIFRMIVPFEPRQELLNFENIYRRFLVENILD